MSKHLKGFTLIELMITVAIIAIIAAIAIPNYSDYVRRSRRTEAKSAALTIATSLEKYLLQNNAYTTNLTDLTGLGDTTTAGITGSGLYQVTIQQQGTGTFAGIANAWYLTVVARAGTSQIDDTDCRTFVYFLTGQKVARSSSNADTTATCWD